MLQAKRSELEKGCGADNSLLYGTNNVNGKNDIYPRKQAGDVRRGLEAVPSKLKKKKKSRLMALLCP